VPVISKRSTHVADTHVETSKKFDVHMETMNSTSSESSIDEQTQTQIDSRLTHLPDEGYSTWSSTDVKDDVTATTTMNSSKKNDDNDNDKKANNHGLVNYWLHTSNNNECSHTTLKQSRHARQQFKFDVH
jgi:hypothetical protein